MSDAPAIPRPGMLATVRNRRALITSVDDHPGSTGRLSYMVGVQYLDPNAPSDDQVLWEYEVGAEAVEPKRLPRIEVEASMRPREFDAVQRAARWLALSPFVGGDGLPKGSSPIASPLFGAIQLEDYQLVPLVRALGMPRVSLALFDDVGLGKSVEAGLILSELILRRRLRRILVLCPAWLKQQWRDEMQSKFALSFDVVDRQETHQLHRRLGMDTNPWRTFPKIIASYHYLKQPDVLDAFRAASEARHRGTAALPWDLLIVDEAHNCMPAPAGDASALSRMLTHISPLFEHKLFLSATPHNGYTQSFTGLLEQLDPVRFTRKNELTAQERRRAEEIVVRRLKSEINDSDVKSGRVPRFVEREIIPLPLYDGPKETALGRAFEGFRESLRIVLKNAAESERMAGYFAVEVLQKRLLSCPYAFADSWHRFRAGLRDEEPVTSDELKAAERAVREEIDDDAETEGRIAYASRVAGAWLRQFETTLHHFVTHIDSALAGLGLLSQGDSPPGDPAEDARFERLVKLVNERLREGTTWGADERLIVFTEYRTTLDYIERRLRARFREDSGAPILVLHGSLDETRREEVKAAFNDPDHPIRILLATDAASEGANLQETSRLLLHWDIPWNPSRLDQRNGRLDRHGQARDVHIFHFTSETDADLRFLGRVLRKVDQIRTDLGSLSELFDAAFQRRFRDLADVDTVDGLLDKGIEAKRRKSRQELPRTPVTGQDDKAAHEWLRSELDFEPTHLRSLLEVAISASPGGPGFAFQGPDGRGRFRFPAVPEGWRGIVDSDVRIRGRRGDAGALPAILFDGAKNVEVRTGRPVYRPAKDAILMHLGHPLVRQALLYLSRARFPGTEEARLASRWIVRRGPVPPDSDALVIVTVEELAVNELRETFHHWVRSLRFPVRGSRLGERLPHVPAARDAALADDARDLTDEARDLWVEVEAGVADGIRRHARELNGAVVSQLERDLREERGTQERLFRERRQELEKQLSRERKDLEKEMSSLIDNTVQEDLFSNTESFLQCDRSMRDISTELARRQQHHRDMLDFLHREERRVIEQLLPGRHALSGEVQVFPVTVEMRFPA